LNPIGEKYVLHIGEFLPFLSFSAKKIVVFIAVMEERFSKQTNLTDDAPEQPQNLAYFLLTFIFCRNNIRQKIGWCFPF